MSTPAQEQIRKYVSQEGVDSDRAVRDTAAERHYEAYLLAGDEAFEATARAIWGEIGLSEEAIAERIREAQCNVAAKNQFDY